MTRITALFIIALLALLGGVACDKDVIVDSPSTGDALFPNAIGSIFQYEILDSINEVYDTAEVRIVGQTVMGNGDVARLWRVEFADDYDTIEVVVKSDTVKMYLGLYSDPTVFILPVAVGDGWSLAPSGGDWHDTTSVVDSSHWAITVGNFKLAYRLDRSWEGPGYTEHNAIYYAPYVGILYMDIEAMTVIEDEDPVDQRWLLLDYSLPAN